MKNKQAPGEVDDRSLAVALAYAPGDAAPRVVAKGRGLTAETIIALARDHEIYVHESPEMVALLMQVDLDDHIPPQLYLAVAELLAWLYRIEGIQTSNVGEARDGGRSLDIADKIPRP